MNEIEEYHYKNENYSIYCEEYSKKLYNGCLSDIFDAKEVLSDYFTKYPAYTKKIQDIKKNLKDYGIYTEDISYIKEYKARAFFPVYDETNNNAFIKRVGCFENRDLVIKNDINKNKIIYTVQKLLKNQFINIDPDKFNFIILKRFDNNIYPQKIEGESNSLAATVSFISLLINKKIPSNYIFTGDIDLKGNILPVSYMEKKIEICLKELPLNGKIFIPENSDIKINSKNIIKVKNLNQVIYEVFKTKKLTIMDRYIINKYNFLDIIINSYYNTGSNYEISYALFEYLYKRAQKNNSMPTSELIYLYKLYSYLILNSGHISIKQSIKEKYIKKFLSVEKNLDKRGIFDFSISAEAKLAIAIKYQDNLEFKKAEKILLGLKEHRYFKSRLEERIHILNTLGQVYIYKGKYKLAEKYLNESLKLAPKNKHSRILNYLGKNAYWDKKYKKAVRYYENSLKVNKEIFSDKKNNAFALIGLGEIYYTKGDYKKTLELCKQILDDNIIEETNYFLNAILYKLYVLSLLKLNKPFQAEEKKKKIESVWRENREYNLIKLICYKGLIEYYIEYKKNKNQDLYKDKSLVKRIEKELNKYIFLKRYFNREIKINDIEEIKSIIKY